MATLFVKLRVKPGMEGRYEEIQRELYRQTYALESNVRRYEAWRAAEERTYYALLSFDDYRSFMVHQTSDHHEAATPPLLDCFEDETFEWVDPIEGAAPLVPTEDQDLGPDASELARTYDEMMHVKVQEWWKPLRQG